MSKTFQARYEGWCPGCGTRIRIGDDVAYDYQRRLQHDGCKLRDPFDAPESDDDDVELEDEEQQIVIGARQPKLCAGCNLEHAGECW